jgi:hypothetical protein
MYQRGGHLETSEMKSFYCVTQKAVPGIGEPGVNHDDFGIQPNWESTSTHALLLQHRRVRNYNSAKTNVEGIPTMLA